MKTTTMQNKYLKNLQLSRQEFLQKKIILKSFPTIYNIGLTLKCNLNCIMCPTRTGPQVDLSGEAIKAIEPYLDYAKTISWYAGGEIFASSQTPQFIELIKKYHPEQSYVSTNFLLFDRWAETLMQSNLTDIGVSIDAASKPTFEKIRSGGKWENLIQNLDYFTELKKKYNSRMRLHFMYVMMNSNLDEVLDFVRLGKKYKVDSINFLRLEPSPSKVEQHEQPSLDIEENLFRQAAQLGAELKVCVKHNRYQWDHDPYQRQSEQNNLQQKFSHQLYPLQSSYANQSFPNSPFCAAPWNEMLITCEGEVTCNGAIYGGDFNYQSMDEVWNGEGFQNLRRSMIDKETAICKDCCIYDMNKKNQQDDVFQTIEILENNKAKNNVAKYDDENVLNLLKLYQKSLDERDELRERNQILENLLKQNNPIQDNENLDLDALYFKIEYLSFSIQPIISTNSIFDVTIAICNRSISVWSAEDGMLPLHVAARWCDVFGKPVSLDGFAGPFPGRLEPNEAAETGIQITAPNTSGNYLLSVDLVLDNRIWFQQRGADILNVSVQIVD